MASFLFILAPEHYKGPGETRTLEIYPLNLGGWYDPVRRGLVAKTPTPYLAGLIP